MLKYLPLAAALAVALPGLAQAQSAAAGQALFQQQCKMCHVAAKGAQPVMAPNLFGVVGRKAASVPGFPYSPALKASHLTWTPATLDRFLTAPARLVPGTRMAIAIPDARQRAGLVAYLATLK